MESQASQQPVSVIICAKNEAENLKQFLPLILTQDYPQHLYEVIVVNDQSTDDTATLLQQLAVLYSHLQVVTIAQDADKHLPGKKYALAKGIEHAQHEQLLLTDADCSPASYKWLQEMTASKKPITLGYGAYEQLPGLLNRFIRWETVHTCMQYISYAQAGIPYMGVGRNMAYHKLLFTSWQQNSAFMNRYAALPSGDDDLLISKAANKHNTAICLQPTAHTISKAKNTWKTWWTQKTRHSSTGKYYPAKAKYLLGSYALSHTLYWLLFGVFVVGILFFPYSSLSLWKSTGCVVYPNYLNIALAGLFITRLLLYWATAALWYKKLGEKKLLLFFPLGDIGWAFYNVFLSPYIFWKNKQQWK